MPRGAEASAWADPHREEIRDLIRRSRKVGWEKALEQLQDQASFFVERMENLALGNWQLLFGTSDPAPTVLDVGCGFGSITLGSSEFARLAVGIDVLSDRVRFGALRADQSGARHAAFAMADGLSTPFRPDTFDIVTLNGVLEWAGLYADGDPRDLQRAMLDEASRLLTSNGVACVAIENSLAAETLLGMKDTHTDVHFVTALPEPLSSLMLRIRKGDDPRVRLHSARGYEKLFEASGLSDVRLFNLVPSYNNYRFVIDVDDVRSHRFVYEHLEAGEFYEPAARLRRFLAPRAPGLLPRLAYSYLIAGQKEPGTTLLDPEAPTWQAFEVSPDLSRFSVQTEEPGTGAILLHSGGAPRSLLKYWVQGTREPEMPDRLQRDLEGALTERRRDHHGGFRMALYDLTT